MKRHALMLIMTFLLVISLAACSPASDSDTLANPPISGTDEQTDNDQDQSSSNTEASADSNSEDNDNAGEPADENGSDQEESDDNASAENEPYYFDNLEFTTLEGETASLHDYEGQLIILNFWATWCKYCVEEMPLLDDLNAQEGYTVLAVNVGEDTEKVRQYLEDYDYNMPIMMDTESELAASFGVNAFPTSIFIGPDFEYYYTFPGMIDDASLNQLLDAIQSYQDSKE